MTRDVVVNDRMQTGDVHSRTEPVGRNVAPGFEPQLTPKEMLELGAFGGKYMTDCRHRFPPSWLDRARLCSDRHGSPVRSGRGLRRPLTFIRHHVRTLA
jgi:hypothetical protein